MNEWIEYMEGYNDALYDEFLPIIEAITGDMYFIDIAERFDGHIWPDFDF